MPTCVVVVLRVSKLERYAQPNYPATSASYAEEVGERLCAAIQARMPPKVQTPHGNSLKRRAISSSPSVIMTDAENVRMSRAPEAQAGLSSHFCTIIRLAGCYHEHRSRGSSDRFAREVESTAVSAHTNLIKGCAASITLETDAHCSIRSGPPVRSRRATKAAVHHLLFLDETRRPFPSSKQAALKPCRLFSW